MFSMTGLLSLPILALAREQKANASSVVNPVHGNIDMPIGITSAWTHPPRCANAANDSEICVFTNSNFRNGRGLSILADPKEVADIDWIELFAKANSPDALNRAEGFRAAQIPGKGVGLVADRVISKGETLMSSTPLIVEHDNAYTLDPEVLAELRDVAVERMSKEQQTMFLSQHRQWGGHHASDIMITNSFMFKEFGGLPRGSTAIFPEVSRFNHACRPNVGYSFDSETLTQSMVATRTIHPGEELTITYVNIIQPRYERIRDLQTGWGFKCTCSHCSRPLADIDRSDQRIGRIREILHTCDNSWAANDTQCGLDMAVESVLLHQEEELTGYPMAAAYYQVKMAAEANGLNSLAIKYGQLAIGEQFGDNYSQAMKMEDEQAKPQENQDGSEGRAKNGKGEDKAAEDQDRLQEELDLGSEQAVIHQVGDATISTPM